MRTFGAKVVDFYNSLEAPVNIPANIEVINPLANDHARESVLRFFSTFFNDTNKRVFALGINPGRFGSGVTGVPFTDPVALEQDCGIENLFDKKKELSSQFVYTFIQKWGGADKFYRDFFLTAVSPVGFVKDGVNFNYYDDEILLSKIKPFIVTTLRKQCDFGSRPTAIILGTGKNQRIFTRLNEEYNFFKKVYVLEHSRYVMQYKRRFIDDYVKKYQKVFLETQN